MNRRLFFISAVATGLVLACANPKPPEPRPCSRCAGSGKVTESFESVLPGRVDCDSRLEETGLFGLGEGITHVTATAYNEGGEGGQFALAIKAGLDGQSKDDAVVLSSTSEWISAHGSVKRDFTFTPTELQNLRVFCALDSPVVVQSKTEVCPVCSGAGQVM